MNDLFRVILSLSLSGTLLFFLVLFTSKLLKERLGRTWSYYIWLLVIFRFLLPITIDNSPMESFFLKVPAFHSVEVGVTEEVPRNNLDFKKQDTEGNVLVQKDHEAFLSPYNYLLLSWFIVGLVLLIRKIKIYRGFVSYMKEGNQEVSDPEILNRIGCVCEELGIKRQIELYENPHVASPLIYGFYKPTIVLTTTKVTPSDLRYIILHELTHYRRRDMFYKWLLQITLCLHWFNPIVYWLVKEVNVACELSCDEAVIRRLGASSKKAYGNVLINSIRNPIKYKQSLSGITLSENAKTVKVRLQAILNYKKKRKSIILISVIMALLLGIVGICIGASSMKHKMRIDNTVPQPISVEGKSDAYKLVADMYKVASSLTVAEYKDEILKLCNDDELIFFNAISDAEIIDDRDPLYSFVRSSLSYTSSEIYAEMNINPGEEAFASGKAERYEYQNLAENKELKDGMSEEEWVILLNNISSDLPSIDKGVSAGYQILFDIPDKTAITIEERDTIIHTIMSTMQEYVDDVSEEDLFADTFASSFQAELMKVTSKYSSDTLSLKCQLNYVDRIPFDFEK